jgi:hypothetical protein
MQDKTSLNLLMKVFNLKHASSLLVMLVTILLACRQEQSEVVVNTPVQVRFSIGANPSGGSGGRTKDQSTPAAVIVTIKDASGNVIENQRVISLHQFGESYLSVPITLTTGQDHLYLSEFFVIGQNNAVLYATPREGSNLAHLVSDPLDITFSITKDVITTVTPEVLAIDAHTNPADYGYGQFGFNIVKTISTVFSSFIKGANNFELTESHLKIEGLAVGTSNDTTVLWTHETDLAAKANTVILKEAVLYRTTATKQGYHQWKRVSSLSSGSTIEIVFESSSLVDIYFAGIIPTTRQGIYWKNDEIDNLLLDHPIMSDPPSLIDMKVYGNDVYVSGTLGFPYNRQALYWKNGQQVTLPRPTNSYADPGGIVVSGGDVYVAGTYLPPSTEPSNYRETLPIYWKNGNMIQLPTTPDRPRGKATNIFVEGADVYVSGFIYTGAFINSRTFPVLWKNGILMELPVPVGTHRYCDADYIKVADGDVYVAGYVVGHKSSGGLSFIHDMTGICWKNGQVIWMGDQTLPVSQYITGLEVSNGNFYVSGYERDYTDGTRTEYTGRIWKNGQEMVIEEQQGARLLSMNVHNDVVYVTGMAGGTTSSTFKYAYWADGKIHLADKRPGSQTYRRGSKIFVIPRH